LQCEGYVNRQYVNQETGDVVNLAVITGPPGPTAVHTPEICYSSRDYSIARERERTLIADKEGNAHTFWATVFESNNPLAERLCVFFAWSDGGNWIASKSPRFEFAGSQKLFKLQLAGRIDPSTDASESVIADFIRELLRSPWNVSDSRS
jgi:hypothetical protein